MAFELAEIVTELVQTILFRGQLKRREDRLVNLSGGPAADGAAVVKQYFEKADDPGVVDFDAGVSD